LTEMESEMAGIRHEPVSIKSVIEDIMPAMSVPLQEKGIEFIKEIEDDLPYVMGDKEKLMLMMNNILLNAVEFTDKGEVVCAARSMDEGVLVSVRDTGKGIPQKDIEAIFDKFVQAGDGLTGKPAGLGLGLPICKHIVDMHGGRIWAESEPGRGSEFFVILPAGSK